MRGLLPRRRRAWQVSTHTRRGRRVDITAWRLMGAHAEGFRRLKAPVVFLRATSEDASLFNFVFEDEDGCTSYGARCLRSAGAACAP